MSRERTLLEKLTLVANVRALQADGIGIWRACRQMGVSRSSIDRWHRNFEMILGEQLFAQFTQVARRN